MRPLYKSSGTQEPLQSDRLPLFVQAAEGLHMLAAGGCGAAAAVEEVQDVHGCSC